MELEEVNKKIAISAPGKFDLFRWAEGFEKEGMLERLYTDFFAPRGSLLGRFRLDSEKISTRKISANPLPRIFRAIAGRFLKNGTYLESAWFDSWVAKNLGESDIFIGRSGASLCSINSAKKKDIKAVLYRGSSHIKFQDAILREEYEKFGVIFSGATDKYIQREIKEYELCDLLYTPSSYSASTYLKQGISADKIIHFPLSSQSFPIEENNGPTNNKKNKFVVLYVGNISLGKGCQYLLEAARILESEKNIEFVFVGGVDASMESIIGKGVPSNVKLLGKVPHHEISKYYAESSVFCFPTIDDGFGQVLLEALSFGVPIIATDHCGAPDIIKQEDCGYLVNIRKAESIAEKILFLYNNEDVLKAMGEVGKERAKEYSVNNFIQRWKTELKKRFN